MRKKRIVIQFSLAIVLKTKYVWSKTHFGLKCLQKDISKLKLKKCGNLTSPIFQASGTFLSYPRLCMWKIYTLLLLSFKKKVYIDAPCKIESPVAYFLFSQQPLGGWPRFSIPHTSFADYSILGSFISSIKILSLFWLCFDFEDI